MILLTAIYVLLVCLFGRPEAAEKRDVKYNKTNMQMKEEL